MSDITTAVSAQHTVLAYGETLHLDVLVINVSAGTVFVVTDRVYSWKGGDHSLEVLLGQPTLGDDYDYYSYIPPNVQELARGGRTIVRFTVGLPPRKSSIGPDGIYAEREEMLAGKVAVSVTVGYLKTAFKPVTTDPAREFTRLQQLATPTVTTVSIAPP